MKKFLALILCLCMVFVLCACGADKNETETVSEKKNEVTSAIKDTAPKFRVTVTDADGNKIEGVVLQMCKDFCLPARSDAEGVATFSLVVTDGYKLSVVSCPEGYEYTGDANIYIEEGATEYTLEITKK